MRISFLELKEKWSSLESNAMKRVCSKHNLDFYIINNNGNKILLLEGVGCERFIQSSKYVRVKITKKRDTYMFYIELEDKNKEEIFIHICMYLINISFNFSKREGFNKVVEEYIKIRKFLATSSVKKLNEIEVKGLIAELHCLTNELTKKYDLNTILQSWYGPDKEQQDFVFSNEWYEVKTTGENAKVIKISSIQQLDNAEKGYLSHVILKKVPKSHSEALSLNKLINDIKTNMSEEQQDIFDTKLIQCGYVPTEDYDEYCYKVKNVYYYFVDKEFPKIIKDNLPTGIDNCTYDLNINSIDKYKVGWIECKN